MGRPLRDDSDIVALRRHYEKLDARQFRVGPDGAIAAHRGA